MLLGGVGSLMESTKPQRFVSILGPETKLARCDNDQDINTKPGGSSISPNAQNLSQPSEFSTNGRQDETKQDSNDRRPGPNFETKLSSMFCVF